MRNQSNTACNTCAVVQHKCTYISLFLSFPFAQSLSVNTVGNRSGKTLNLVPFFPPIHKRTHTYIMRLWFASFAWGLNFKSVDVSIFSPRMITCVFLHVCVTHSTKCTFDQAVVIDTYFVPVSACGWLLWHSVNTIISTESQCHWSRSRAIGMLWPPENFHIGEQSLQQDWSCSNGWTDGWKNKINDGTNVISDVLCLFTTVFLSNELRDCSPASLKNTHERWTFCHREFGNAVRHLWLFCSLLSSTHCALQFAREIRITHSSVYLLCLRYAVKRPYGHPLSYKERRLWVRMEQPSQTFTWWRAWPFSDLQARP